MRILWMATLSLVACGPAEWITESSQASAPPRPSDCVVEFIPVLGPKDFAPQGPYQLLGYITLARDAAQEPAKRQTREKVRARACRRGGEAMATWDFKVSPSGNHTEIDYAVVRKAAGP
jgi:hypothetical protein